MVNGALIKLLDDSVKALPGGSMGGGTRMVAAAFVDKVRGLTDDEIHVTIKDQIEQSPNGDFHNWLISLPQ